MSTYIKFTYHTVIKQTDKLDSTALSDSGNKFTVAKDSSYPVSSFEPANAGHIKVHFTHPVGGKYTWYVFEAHAQLFDENGQAVKIKPQEDTAPNLTRNSPAEKPVLTKKAETFNLFGYKINLDEPIIAHGNFTWREATHNGTRIPNVPEHVDGITTIAKKAQVLRDKLNKPMHVLSWYRPEPWNSRAGGAPRSTHLFGYAMDFWVEGFTGRQLADMFSWWEGGMGVYPNYPYMLHIDARVGKARW